MFGQLPLGTIDPSLTSMFRPRYLLEEAESTEPHDDLSACMLRPNEFRDWAMGLHGAPVMGSQEQCRFTQQMYQSGKIRVESRNAEQIMSLDELTNFYQSYQILMMKDFE